MNYRIINVCHTDVISLLFLHLYRLFTGTYSPTMSSIHGDLSPYSTMGTVNGDMSPYAFAAAGGGDVSPYAYAGSQSPYAYGAPLPGSRSPYMAGNMSPYASGVRKDSGDYTNSAAVYSSYTPRHYTSLEGGGGAGSSSNNQGLLPPVLSRQHSNASAASENVNSFTQLNSEFLITHEAFLMILRSASGTQLFVDVFS